MVNTRKVAYEAQTVNTTHTAEKALPEEARLSGGSFFHWHGWPVWLGVATVVVAAVSWGLAWLGVTVVLCAAVSWGLVTYVDRVGREFFCKGQDVVVTLNTMARALRSRDLATLD